jgi:iodothyronine deiodinase-like protein
MHHSDTVSLISSFTAKDHQPPSLELRLPESGSFRQAISAHLASCMTNAPIRPSAFTWQRPPENRSQSQTRIGLIYMAISAGFHLAAQSRLYQQYKDQVEFYLVYIQEAHASDAWQLAVNEKEKVIFKDPQRYDERTEIAGTCSVNLGIEFPALVDSIQNSTERAYTAWPDRLYVIDREGKVAFKSSAGPFGFKAQQVSDVLSQIVPAKKVAANLR